MALQLPEPPAQGEAVVRQALAEVASALPGWEAAGPVTLARPYRVYEVGLDTLSDGQGVAAARPVGWKYLVIQDNAVVQDVELAEAQDGPRFATVTRGPFVREAQEMLERAEVLGGGAEHSYELRYLRAPGLCLDALWLKDKQGDADTIIPVPPAPAPFGIEAAYTRARFAEMVRAPAAEALKFDRENRQASLDEVETAAAVRQPAPRRVPEPVFRRAWPAPAPGIAALLAMSLLLAAALVYHYWPTPPPARPEIDSARLALEAEKQLGGPVEPIEIGRDGRYHVKEGRPLAVRIDSPRDGYASVALLGPGVGAVYPLPGRPDFPVKASVPVTYPSLPGPSGDTLLFVVVTAEPFADPLRRALADDLPRYPEADVPVRERVEAALKGAGQKWAVVGEARLVPDKP